MNIFMNNSVSFTNTSLSSQIGSKGLGKGLDNDDNNNDSNSFASSLMSSSSFSTGSSAAVSTTTLNYSSPSTVYQPSSVSQMLNVNSPATITQPAALDTDTTISLDAQKSDFGGKMTSFSKNGINITVEDPDHTDGHTPGTMTWIDTGKAAGGIGMLGNGNKTKDTGAENVTIALDDAANTLDISLVDHGSKNSDDSITFQVYQEGNSSPTEVTLTLDSNAPDKVTTFSFDASDYGDGSAITQVVLYSTSNTPGGVGEASFLIGGIEATYGDVSTTPAPAPDPVPAPDLTPVDDPVFIVASNLDDKGNSEANYIVGDGFGAINGGDNNDIIVGDVGGGYSVNPAQVDFNVVMMMDTSGSMSSTFSDGTTRLDRLVDAVENLITDFNGYDNGDIQVHFVPFDTTAWGMQTFTVTNDTDFSDAITYLNLLTPGGVTNYESALQTGISWLEGNDPISGAITTSYFISDGWPNYAIDDATGLLSYSYTSSFTAMEEIQGLDGSNEIEEIQTLSDDVIGVGINTSSANLDLIDSSGSAITVTNPTQLSQAFAESNPLNKLDNIGDDIINGGAGSDYIFGDALYTDDLAVLHNLGTIDGAGWEVFELLEAGSSSSNANWSHDDTLSYIVNNTDELMQESIDQEGAIRVIGSDVIHGGAGDDFIFAQEGNDTITGGLGDDIIYGGGGADLFVFESILDGVDHIADFSSSEGDMLDFSSIITGYDPMQHSIDDFVMMSQSNGSTTISVDVTGSGNAALAQDFAILDNVVNVDLSGIVII